MGDFITKLGELNDKAQYLQQKSDLLVSENQQLKEKLQLLKQNIAEKNLAVAELHDQLNILKLAKNIESGDHEKIEELKSKINKYIREIDQCLKLLGD